MKAKSSPGALFLFLLIGCVLGSALWTLLGAWLPDALQQAFSIGTSAPWTLDLAFVQLTLGVALRVNLGSLLGMALALVLFWKL